MGVDFTTSLTGAGLVSKGRSSHQTGAASWHEDRPLRDGPDTGASSTSGANISCGVAPPW